MKEDSVGCIIFVLLAVLILGSQWLICDRIDAYKDGYVQALVDIERKRPMRYKRAEKENGETTWIKNEEKVK